MNAQPGSLEGLLNPNTRTFRTIVTGARDWLDRSAVWYPLDRLLQRHGQLLVVHGDCPSGADLFARQWAERHEVDGARQRRFPADWGRFRGRSGSIRNGHMVAFGADLVLAFGLPCTRRTYWCPAGEHPSHGTANCVQQARDAGITVKFCPEGMSW